MMVIPDAPFASCAKIHDCRFAKDSREVCMPYKYSFCLKKVKGLFFAKFGKSRTLVFLATTYTT